MHVEVADVSSTCCVALHSPSIFGSRLSFIPMSRICGSDNKEISLRHQCSPQCSALALQVLGMLQVLAATDSLVLAAANLTSNFTNYTWPTASGACQTDGPSSRGDLQRMSRGNEAFSVDDGLGRDDIILDYDQSFVSFVGCRCLPGYDNVYTFDAEGKSAFFCWFTKSVMM